MSYINDGGSYYPDFNSAITSFFGIIFCIIIICLLIISIYTCIILCNEECNNINDESSINDESL